MKDLILPIALGILGIAPITVLLSQNATTTSVFRTAFSGFGNVLGVAMGNDTAIDLSYTN